MNEKTDETSETSLYTLIGGEATVRALVKRFYELMDTLPEARDIRKMHTADLAGIEEKLFMYLTGWLGGPQLYVEKYGHPMLRARHLPFSIGMSEVKQWLICMRRALEETIPDQSLRTHIDSALTGLALHMRNRTDSKPEDQSSAASGSSGNTASVS